jgi:predicted RNase H-like HicB family nuclease
MKAKPIDRYPKIVEWSDEDKCYIGTCPGLMYGGVHGKNEAKVFKELCQVAKEVIQLYRDDKKPLPRPFRLT